MRRSWQASPLEPRESRLSAQRSFCASRLYAFFARSRLGVAMQASSQNQLAAYYMGIPVRRLVSLVWAIAAVIATIAGTFMGARDATGHERRFHRNQGAFRRDRWWLRFDPRDHPGLPPDLASLNRLSDYYFPAIKGVSAYIVMLVVLFIRPDGLIYANIQEEGLMQIVFKTSYDQDINLLSKTGEYIRVTLVVLFMLAGATLPGCLLPVRNSGCCLFMSSPALA